MAFDYDVIVIGSGFGGSVAALRATEKGRRWPDDQVPKTSCDIRKFAWQPEAEMYGIQGARTNSEQLISIGGNCHVLYHRFMGSWRLRCSTLRSLGALG
jgi:cholesterol oxidase